jgi:hypothetical protein
MGQVLSSVGAMESIPTAPAAAMAGLPLLPRLSVKAAWVKMHAWEKTLDFPGKSGAIWIRPGKLR